MSNAVNQEKTSVALGSVFASAALTLMKLVVGLLTGSIGILSEAAHSLLDFAAAGLTYFAVRGSDKPGDDLCHAGYELGRRTLDILLDTAPEGVAE